MKITPYLKRTQSLESPIYIRLRDTYNGSDNQSIISVGFSVEPKYFKNGLVTTRHSDYLLINEEINRIIAELNRIYIEFKTQGSIPLPNLVKKTYLDGLKQKRFDTEKIVPFWKAMSEWRETKKGLSRGYTKTLLTLENRLRDFEKDRGIPISFSYVIGSTQLFQSQFQNFLWEERKLTNGYINKLLNSLSSFLHYSQEMGYVKKKPRFKKQQTPSLLEKPFLRTDEVIKLFNSDKFDFKSESNWKKLKLNKKYAPHLYLIQQELKGSKSNKYGGYLTITNWELVRFIHLWCCSVGCRYGDVAHFKVNDFTFDRENKHMEWIQQKTKRRNSVPINDISGYIFTKFSSGKRLDQELFPPLSIQKFNKHIKLLLKALKFNREMTVPKQRGSNMIDNVPKPLHELIRSHSGRHSFITNTIEMGTMDYKTIMSLSGHTTTSSFLGYVSVLENQRNKASKLYKVETDKKQNTSEEIVKLFENLDDNDKTFLLSWMRSKSK
jgi:hypothetical protein